MATNQNNTATQNLLTNIIAGLKKNQPNGSFLIGGVTYTTAALVKILQQILTAMAGVPPAKGAYQKAVLASRTLSTQYGELVLGLKQMLQIEYTGNPDLLSDYGLAARKPTGVRTPKVKVAAADKALATRTARHTLGPKQKKGITGATAAPATPTEAPAPAGTTASSAPTGVTPVVTPGH